MSTYAWGNNSSGQLGNGSTVLSPIPVQVSGLSDVEGIASGSSHNLAFKSDGTVWTWGRNDAGQLGDNTTTNRYHPVKVVNSIAIVAVAGGYSHSLAHKADGTVWAWGANQFGQLGDNTTDERHTPVQVLNSNGAYFTDVIAIACGSRHSLALKTDGTIWAWGRNAFGQLGDNTTDEQHTPVQVVTSNGTYLTDIVAIAGGSDHSLALKADGTVWAWGRNDYGQLGDNTTDERHTPVQVVNSGGTYLTEVTAIAGGSQHSLALKTDGTVWAWGWNHSGQLGDNTTDNKYSPVQVVTNGSGVLTSIAAIAGGHAHSLALKTDGSVWAWGDNSNGQLGNGTTADSNTPQQVTGLTGGIIIAAKSYDSLALSIDLPTRGISFYR